MRELNTFIYVETWIPYALCRFGMKSCHFSSATRIVASQKSQHIASCSMLLPFVIILQTLCSPSEDFGSPNEPLGRSVRGTFQRAVAQVGYSHSLEKCLEKTFPTVRLDFQNLRLGEHKLVTKPQHQSDQLTRCVRVFL